MYRDTCEVFRLQARTGSSVGVPVTWPHRRGGAPEPKPHFEAFETVLKMPVEMLLPPGYTSRESLKM